MIVFAYSRQQNEIETSGVSSLLFFLMTVFLVALSYIVQKIAQAMEAKKQRA